VILATQARPAEQKRNRPTPPAPAAAAPQAPADAVGSLQPVLHAQKAKITTCMDTIARQSAAVIDAPHAAISSWTNAAPDQNLFVSMVGLSYKSPLAPAAAAVILAAPIGPDRCEGEVVQVIPSARSCTVIQASLVKTGRTIATLQGLAVVQTNTGVRDLLLPTAGGGCTLVAVGVQE
jgi:subtilisin family serine protease